MKSNSYQLSPKDIENRIRKSKEVLEHRSQVSPKMKLEIIKEQDFKCLFCGISSWADKVIALEIHHIDGNRINNERSNTIGLCPNCHSQTENYSKRKR
jgi:5-methylcytosine-specific restriction endonuclease McrA